MCLVITDRSADEENGHAFEKEIMKHYAEKHKQEMDSNGNRREPITTNIAMEREVPKVDFNKNKGKDAMDALMKHNNGLQQWMEACERHEL